MRLAGIEVSTGDADTLIDLLQREGRAADLMLASRIEGALAVDVLILALSPEEQDLLLGVLVNPPERLAPLRGRLARAHRDRA